MLNIAFILPCLSVAGPEVVAHDIISGLLHIDPQGIKIDVYYFYEYPEKPVLTFPVPCYKINFEDKIDFAKYDVIHAHCFASDKYIYKNKKYIKGIAINTTHNIVYDEWKYSEGVLKAFIYQYRYAQYIKKMDGVVCLTHTMKKYYSRFIPSSRITVIPNGRNVVKGDIAEEDKTLFHTIRQKYKCIAGAPCWVTKRKGLHQFVSILPDFPDTAFVIIGEGDAKEALKRLAKELGVEAQCFFLTRRPNGSDYFAWFDFYIMSSYSEGVSLSLLEASGHGTPTLCSDIAQNRELFGDAEVAYFQLDNAVSMRNAFQNLRENATLLGNNMHKKYLANYTADVMAQSYLDLYKKVLSAKALAR